MTFEERDRRNIQPANRSQAASPQASALAGIIGFGATPAPGFNRNS
jgi:hypothetical protein